MLRSSARALLTAAARTAGHASTLHSARGAEAAALSSIATPAAAACPGAAVAAAGAGWSVGRRWFSHAAALRAPSKRPSSGSKQTTTTHFSPQPRRSSMDPIGGALAEPARAGQPTALTLQSLSRTAVLNPQRLSRGGSAKSAKMERALHASNRSKLNHSLAYYIDRTRTWSELVPLLFEHMHHMTAHNYVRASQRLVALSPSRPLLDADLYTQFGRFMVQLETHLADLESQGLMRLIFVPYHYLRQCLQQMRVAQEKALEAARADPEAAKAARKAARMAEDAAKESALEQRTLDDHLAAKQSVLASRSAHSYGRGEDKSKKMRAKEHRAGRVFTSVAATIKQRSGNSKRGKDRPGRVW